MSKTRKNKERNDNRKMMEVAKADRKERSDIEKEFAGMTRKKLMQVYNDVKASSKDIMNSNTYNVLVKYITRQQRRDLKVEWGILKVQKA